jgi:hypothetical protein
VLGFRGDNSDEIAENYMDFVRYFKHSVFVPYDINKNHFLAFTAAYRVRHSRWYEITPLHCRPSILLLQNGQSSLVTIVINC